MANERVYRALRLYGTKLHKFQHRKSHAQITQDVFGEDADHLRAGVCLGANLIWQQELSGLRSSPQFIGSQADSAAQHRHNASIVLAAAHLQLQYERDGDLSAAIQRAGFSEPEVELSDAMRDDSGTQVPGHACLRDPVRAIIDAVDPIRLAPGWGVLVNVTRFFASTGEDPGTRHLVSFHRAHSGELQFFEVRVGVYTVNVLAGFVLAWRDAYLTLGRQVELVPSQGRPFVYIRV